MARESSMTWSGLKAPLAVEIEINSYCNRKCPYCPNSRLQRPEQGDMDDSLFDLLLEQLAALEYRGRISYHFYNEPMLSPKLDQFVALTRRKLPTCRTELYTNGTLLTEGRFSELVELGIDKFTVTRHAGAQMKEFEEFYSRLDRARQGRIYFRTHNELIYSSRGGLVPGFTSAKVKAPLSTPCFVPFSTAIVTVKGNVVPCFEDYLQRNVMGNIRERHFGEIWASEKYVSFRNATKRGERSLLPVCRDCDNVLVVS